MGKNFCWDFRNFRGVSKHPSINNIFSFVFVILVIVVVTSGYEGRDFQNTLPAKVVWGIPGKDIELPCDVTPPVPSDAVKMVFWFKDSTTMPIYSLDARNGPLEKASHLAAAYDVGSRSYFITDHPSRARLKIKNVTPEDEGIFRCRVDFLNSPTRNFQINLTLVELSSRPKIFDAEGKLIKSEAGPFLEGHELFLSCQVDGGRPRPSLTWWHKSTILDNVVDTKKNSFTTVNQLEIAQVPRSLKGAKLECRATSMDIAGDIVREVPIVVYLRPTKVKIVTPNELMSSAKTHTYKCETSGSYPPAKLTWKLNGRTITSAVITQEENESFSSSIIALTVDPEDDGKDLVCKAENPRFPGSSLEDRRQVHVAYPPKVAVKVSDGTIPATEGVTVVLRCDTIARPAAHNFSWYQDGHLVRYNETSGVLPMDDKLTLRNIKKSAAGEYSCSATNTEGETYSPPYRLEIQYAPRCKFGFEEMRVGLLPHGLTTIKCHVDAVPNSVRFSWTYNTSQGVLPVQGARIENKDDVSTLHFMPGSADIDSLSCWASNVVGRQEIPCLFHVMPANWPESPRNCVLNNLTHGSLEVKCTAGADGGLAQSFILEVMDTTGVYTNPSGVTTLSDQAEHSTPLFRVLGDVPVFRLHSLRPRRDYQLVVYAQNAKGRSRPPVVLSNVRIELPSDVSPDFENDAEANLSGETGNVEEPMKQNLTLILLGLTASAVLLIVGIVSVATVLACRKQQSNSGNNAVVLRQRRSSKPPDDLELSEAGFGEGFHRRSAQYRASLYAQEVELEANIRQTGDLETF